MIEEKWINFLSFSTTHLKKRLEGKRNHSLIDLLHRNEPMVVKMGPHHPSDAWCPSNFRPIVVLDSEDVVTKALDWWRTCFYNKFDVVCSSPINSGQFQTLSLPNASYE